MNKGIVPRSGIDTLMQDGGDSVILKDGYLVTNYIYMISSTGLTIYQLAAVILQLATYTKDNQMYNPMTSSR